MCARAWKRDSQNAGSWPHRGAGSSSPSAFPAATSAPSRRLPETALAPEVNCGTGARKRHGKTREIPCLVFISSPTGALLTLPPSRTRSKGTRGHGRAIANDPGIGGDGTSRTKGAPRARPAQHEAARATRWVTAAWHDTCHARTGRPTTRNRRAFEQGRGGSVFVRSAEKEVLYSNRVLCSNRDVVVLYLSAAPRNRSVLIKVSRYETSRGETQAWQHGNRKIDTCFR